MRLLRRRRADDAATLPEDLRRLEAATEIAAGHLDAPALERARTLLKRAGERENLAAGRTVAALLGATGSGKSSLFNALLGREVAPVAARRPTTTRPLAAVWGADDAGRLLDWLDVPDRTRAGDGTDAATTEDRAADGLILLDLPDIDSTAMEHRDVASRMAGAVDVLVWVLDPQKYADAVVHRDYLAHLTAHAEVSLVVLNQVDTLDADERAGVLADLERVLERDGLSGVPVLPVSARTGEGLDDLWRRVADVAASTRAARLRLAADVRATATELLRAAEVATDINQGRRRRDESPTTVGEQPAARLSRAAAEAAGVDAVRAAVRRSYTRSARARVGWPPVRWLIRLRPDPLRRLGLTRAERADVALVRTSLPAATPVQQAAVRSAAHAVVASSTAHLPGPWRDDVLQQVEGRIPALVDALDRRIAGTDLEQARRPAWWTVAGILQWLFVLAAVAGGVWLAGLAALGYLQLPAPETPAAGPVPWPTVLLVGGVLAGLLLTLLGALAARAGARRRARRVERRLRAEVDAAVREQVVAAVEHELEEFATFRRNLTALAG